VTSSSHVLRGKKRKRRRIDCFEREKKNYSNQEVGCSITETVVISLGRTS
jgi:hypothetical protein